MVTTGRQCSSRLRDGFGNMHDELMRPSLWALRYAPLSPNNDEVLIILRAKTALRRVWWCLLRVCSTLQRFKFPLTMRSTHAVHVENFQSRYCESCRSQLARGASLGLLSQRRDSVISASASSRRGSLAFSNPSNSRPGSRRGSILVPPHLAGLGLNKTPHGPSGLGSRPGSRRTSFSKSGGASGSGTTPGTPVLH